MGSTEIMRLHTNNNVGIGTSTPSYKLDVVGDINSSGCLRSSVGVSSGTCVSDERLKSEIQPFDLGLDALMGITPKYFKYNGRGGHPVSPQLELGVIAQDVEKTAPQLINTRMVKLNPEDKNLTEVKQVNYTAFSYVVINAVKELYHKLTKVERNVAAIESQIVSESAFKDQQIQNLKQENAAQSIELNELRARLDRIENSLKNK